MTSSKMARSLLTLEENMEQLKQFTTCDLVRELELREGVETHVIEPYEMFTPKIEGAAVVFVVVD